MNENEQQQKEQEQFEKEEMMKQWQEAFSTETQIGVANKNQFGEGNK